MISYTTQQFLRDVHAEVERAREKFPDPDASMTALTEEVGELAQAFLDKPWTEVYKEAVQVAAMALRVATEGDPTLGETRAKRGNGDGPRCPYKGCPNGQTARPPCGLCYE